MMNVCVFCFAVWTGGWRVRDGDRRRQRETASLNLNLDFRRDASDCGGFILSALSAQHGLSPLLQD